MMQDKRCALRPANPHDTQVPSDASQLLASEIEVWAMAYSLAQQSPDLTDPKEHPMGWAIERFMLFAANGRVLDCWRAILAVLRISRDPEVLGVLAAGPLEDLIAQADPSMVDRMEWEARTNPAFGLLLQSTWECGHPGVWHRLLAVPCCVPGALVAGDPASLH